MIDKLDIKKILRLGLVLLISGMIIIYAFSRSYEYLKGPQITLFEPKNGIATSSSTINIKGLAHRINEIRINGSSILMDERGNFNETVALLNGINYITITGKDRFNRETKKYLRILGLK
jgi:hypothetical protein